MPKQAASTVQSVERAFAILDLVAAGSSTLTEISSQVDLPKSTVARLLATLVFLKAVERTGAGTYDIGPRVAELVGSGERSAHLRRAVLPHLQRLSEQLGEATGFAVPDGPAVRNISQVGSATPVQVRDYTGMVVPAHIGSPSLALMATWSDEEVDAYLDGPLERYTASTVTDPEAIRARLATIRHDGYAVVVDEFADGISSVAACLIDESGQALGTIHAHGPTYRFPPVGMAPQVGTLVVATARAILGSPAGG